MTDVDQAREPSPTVPAQTLQPLPQRTPLTVCFVPFEARNPYQRELARYLQREGTHVTNQRSLKGVVSDIRHASPPPDIIHLHWLPRFSTTGKGVVGALMVVARILFLKALGKKIVWTVHNLYSHESLSRRLERWLARFVIATAARVVVHSNSAPSLVAAAFGLKTTKKFSVVPHGNYIGCYADTLDRAGARARLCINEKDFVFVFFGNIRPYKGVFELIQAFEQLPHSSSLLLIAGRPINDAIKHELQGVAAQNPDIHLCLDDIADEDVQLYLKAGDVVILPYRDVLTSGAVILAMSFGRPCIAPVIGCIPDVLDERGAFLYDPINKNGLEQALQAALRHQERLPAMGVHNRQKAKAWGWDTVAQQTAIIYREVSGSCPVSPPRE